ncbi:MAG: hypothetical protein KAS32_12490 [Candidatus Peribacteraceae bacterium]|nr:hypothetical protein [Candidatus Peribacteraceae bacterium]
MGLETKTGGNYITILGGKFCQRVQEGTEGAVTRTNKIGNVVHEKFYDSFTGKLIAIKVQEGTYGKTWNFIFQDKEDPYTLQLSYSNSFSTAFLKMLPNIDLTKEMKLSPSVKEVDGKNRSSLFVNQNGKALKHAFTREVPNGMPDMEQITVAGVLQWDDTKRLVFLQNMVDTLITPKLEAIVSSSVASVTTPPVAPVAPPMTPVTPAPVAPTTSAPAPAVSNEPFPDDHQF